MTRRLYRSDDDRVLAGVAGGMAETWDLDPALVRVGWVILALFTGGAFLLVYIVMALVVPLAPDNQPAATWPGGSWPTASGVGPAGAPGVIPAAAAGVGPAGAPGVSQWAAPGASQWAAPPPEDSAPEETSSYTARMPPESPAGDQPYDAEAQATMSRPSTQPFLSEREMRRQRRSERRQGGGDMAGALVIGLILIVIGGYFLLRDFLPNIAWGQLWPIGLIAIGLLLLVGAIRRTSR
ncbi:hypothetical protein BH23CHL7_BH23CHL7_19260 [soil metagenome]